MVFILLLLAAVFGYLAIDAHRIGKPPYDATYEIKTSSRNEHLGGVSLAEQQQRKDWQRSHGIGKLSDIVWLWSILSGAFLLAALVAIY